MATRESRRVRARYIWDSLKLSFWFAPLVMSIGAILLAWAMYWLDGLISNETLQSSHFFLSGTPSELRSGLIGMAGTVLATAGVVFTLLTIPLSTVVAQYGSRLLRVFLGDRTSQFVLGMFAATFIYCLAAALSIPPADVQPAVPQITATVGLYLMVATFASLILLVQHISTMLQAPNIAAAAGARLVEVVTAEISDEVTRAGRPGQEAVDALLDTDGQAVRIQGTGYIQYIDPETIITLAQEKNLVIRLQCEPGQFVWLGAVVALVWPTGPRLEGAGLRSVDKVLESQILMAFRFGNTRIATQDIEYAVNQLVEMAVRAMSPAINDPFTAMTCLDYIGEGLGLFVRKGERDPHFYDRDGRLRLIFERRTFAELLNRAFDMLRHCSSDNASVLQHMLETIDVIGKEAKSPKGRQELLRQVSLIQAESQASRLIDDDRQLIQRSCETLVMKLSGAGK
jgi:uncharacterized membrane protein